MISTIIRFWFSEKYISQKNQDNFYQINHTDQAEKSGMFGPALPIGWFYKWNQLPTRPPNGLKWNLRTFNFPTHLTRHDSLLVSYLIRINFRTHKFSCIFHKLDLLEIVRKLVQNFWRWVHSRVVCVKFICNLVVVCSGSPVQDPPEWESILCGIHSFLGGRKPPLNNANPP